MSAGVAPPFRYLGGKSSFAGAITRVFPEHRVYVEPFAGSCSVLLAKDPSPVEVVNDLDGDLVAFWRVLRDRPEELARACELTPHSRAEHALCAKRPPWLDDLERARRTWVSLVQGWKPTTAGGGWRLDARVGRQACEVSRGRLSAVAERMRAVALECRDALEVVALHGANPDALLYVDPPYHDSYQGSYRHRLESEDAHRALAEALRACAAAVVLSGRPGALYDELYADWDRVDLGTAGKRWNESPAARAAPRREVLWSNRALPEPGEAEK